MLQKISISDKRGSFELSIHLWILKTRFHSDNVSWAYYYDFWISCDTEDWSNDAENTDK